MWCAKWCGNGYGGEVGEVGVVGDVCAVGEMFDV